MERGLLVARLTWLLGVAFRQRLLDDARRRGWPLPQGLAVHLWLYACGLAPPSRPAD
jgi:hypothetical protein